VLSLDKSGALTLGPGGRLFLPGALTSTDNSISAAGQVTARSGQATQVVIGNVAVGSNAGIRAGSGTDAPFIGFTGNGTTGSGTAAIQFGHTQVAFFSGTPRAQAAPYTRDYVSTSRTLALSSGTSVPSTPSTQTGAWYYPSSGDAAAIPAAINGLVIDIANVKQVLGSVLSDLQSYGLLK
jgi:hypothetical protein